MRTSSNGTSKSTSVRLLSARGMTTIAVLAAVASFLMIFEVKLWFAPGFYELDISELPVLVGAFALGPVAGILIEVLKIGLNLLLNGSDTAMIGEMANLLVGCALVIPSAIIYHRKRTKKAAVLGMIVGTICFVTVGGLLNAYVLLPTYANMYGGIEKIIAAGTAVNSRITDLKTFIFLAVVPFNLLKGTVVSLLTSLIYKRVSHLVKEFHLPKQQLQKSNK